MRVVFGSDHAGFGLKSALIAHVTATSDHVVIDLGTHSIEPVDYPPICAEVARTVVRGGADVGVVIGGSGQGEQIAANKVHGARAALCHDEFTARFARRHNDANVLSIGARVTAAELAAVILDLFLLEEFEGGRHLPRIEQLRAIEREECGPQP